MAHDLDQDDLLLLETKDNKAELKIDKVKNNRIYFERVRDKNNAFKNVKYIDLSWLANDWVKHIKKGNWGKLGDVVIYKD